MSLTFKSLGIDDYLEQSTTGTTTSYTFDINNSSGTTAGDSGFMIVMGSWNTTADVSTLFQTSFLDSSGNTINTKYRTTSTNTTSTRSSYNKNNAASASNNYFQPHNMSSASSTAFDGERHHFMFHISFNPQTSSSGQPMGYLHCSGHYIVTETSGNIVVGYCDQNANNQNNASNKIQQMRISTSSGFMTNLRVKVYRLGAR